LVAIRYPRPRVESAWSGDIGPTASRRIIEACGCAQSSSCSPRPLSLCRPAAGLRTRASDAAAVAEGFYGAIEQGDGREACAALAEEARSKLEQQEQAPCEEAILELELPRGATPAETSVYVTTASVSLTEGGKAFLDESASGWKVSAAGCTRTAPTCPTTASSGAERMRAMFVLTCC
jgi:hypothetical protein